VQIAIQRAAVSAAASPDATRARSSLDENAWSQLRRSCPARPGDHAIDVKVAKRILADPVLYSQAVHAITASQNLASAPPAGATLSRSP